MIGQLSRTNVFALSLLFVATALPGARAAKYHNLRYEDPPIEEVRTWSDNLKGMSLNESESVTLSIGGQARLRWEVWDNFGFVPENDDDFGLLRLRLHGDARFGKYVRVFAEGKSSLILGDRDLPGGNRSLDVDTLDLQNGFVDLFFPSSRGEGLTLRTGRQELQYGKQRFVSPLDWANVRRTFDGIRAITTLEDRQFDVFWTKAVEVEKYDFNDVLEGSEFYGLYAAKLAPATPCAVDAYYLGLGRDNATFGDKTGSESRHTLGIRTLGNVSDTPLDLEFEAAFQFGTHAGRDIEAFAVTTKGGLKMADWWSSPRFYLGFDYASGDDGDGALGTFNQLFPLGHAYLGHIDIVGRQNIIDFSQGLFLWPIAGGKFVAKVENHIFWRADSNDALYNAGGGVVRGGDTGSASEVGSELDFTFVYKHDASWALLAGYDHFFAGDFIKESGPSEDIDFAYLSAQYTF
jgi:hypothetical protein